MFHNAQRQKTQNSIEINQVSVLAVAPVRGCCLRPIPIDSCTHAELIYLHVYVGPRVNLYSSIYVVRNSAKSL